MRRRVARLRWAAIVVGTALIATAVGWQVRVTLWERHSAAVGSSLVAGVRAEQARGRRSFPGAIAPVAGRACLEARRTGGSGARGILLAPSIALTAPVLQGSGDGVLAVAVGHDPSSVWPGSSGNAVLLAHDVSYFVNIDKLRTGQLVRYENACSQLTFRVAGHRVVRAGSPVYDTTTPTMTLVTCWPTDALWFTPDRYLVTLDEVTKGPLTAAGSRHDRVRSAVAPRGPELTVPAPAALVAQGLTLSTSSVPMGTMSFAGNPSEAWRQSPGPLGLEVLALESYLGAVKSLAGRRVGWWDQLAPGLDPPASLGAGGTISYLAPLDVTVRAQGSIPSGSVLDDVVKVSGGRSPGSYHLRVSLSVVRGRLLIIAWAMTPAAS